MKAVARALPPELDPALMPKHIAIVMDGNRRWAKARRLPVIEGHRRGMLALREVTRSASDFGVGMLTVYGFSTENWKREKTEISLLFDLAVYFAQNELAELNRNNVRVVVIGAYQALPRPSREAMEYLMAKTAGNDGLQLNLAVNYSARAELQLAVANLARDVAAGRLLPDSIDDATLASYLYTSNMPDPDLLVRPGGESRLSNFLLFQLAQSELYVTEVLWPDFGRDELARAVAAYQTRLRAGGES
ncbi:MAG TPA: polyprenyl diphosphate synthase [Candidatus Baltobacteraceae bacterium]|nr:polyprenyl diphosphate synthase [Candidatus Baltobacteraceae bacterium]